MSWRQDLRRGERGFTLIELLVVILILGILLAIALPSFLGQKDKARDAEAQSYLNSGYKTAKASSTTRGGAFVNGGFDASDLAAEILANDPEIGSAQAAVSANPAGILAGSLYVIDDPGDSDDTSTDDLALAYRSQSNSVFYLRIVDWGGVDLDDDFTYNP